MTWTAPIAVETSVALEATGYVCGEDGDSIDRNAPAQPASRQATNSSVHETDAEK